MFYVAPQQRHLFRVRIGEVWVAGDVPGIQKITNDGVQTLATLFEGHFMVILWVF